MEDKFSIENFVEDSVPSIENNDIVFRSISDEIDKRIAAAGQRTRKRVVGRAQRKLSKTNTEIQPDTEKTEEQEFRISYNAEDTGLQSTEESFLGEEEDCEIEIDRAAYARTLETVWRGSVLDRLRASGCMKDGGMPDFSYADANNQLREAEEKKVQEPEKRHHDPFRDFSYDEQEHAKRISYGDADAPSFSAPETVFVPAERQKENPLAESVLLMPAAAAAEKDPFDPIRREEEETEPEEPAASIETQFRMEQSAFLPENEQRRPEKRHGRIRSVRRGEKEPAEGSAETTISQDTRLAVPAVAASESAAMVSAIPSVIPVAERKPEKRPKRKYSYPTVDLIMPDPVTRSQSAGKAQSEEETRLKAAKLADTLKSFGIGITITGITRGPSVTRFEFQPEVGVKISKIVALTDDIALNLAASAVRMEAPIPGKPAIGIEIPNEQTDTVYLYDVLNTPEYRAAKSKISFALGKDIEGRTVIADLAKMPHVLIAGSTGSGKSVCINTIISGILYGASPDEVKFIMIDPKVVELGIYNSIPHLLIPVVTEPKKASAALAWAVMEVERRYRLFAEHNVRDIFSFNRGIKERPEMADQEKMPQIVIIIDELADLMMVASQDVEKSIIRLAQKARAAGVHLVIATQRPSVDVITGIIKANIPSRIAFAVASQFDSRTILDNAGAEKLLGRGDMLYHPIGSAKSVRVQGAFISDSEVERITEFVKNSYGMPEYDSSVAESIENAVLETQKNSQPGKTQQSEETDEASGDDELIESAAELGFSLGQLSISLLQRKLKLGYSRAARIIDALEELGFLSAADGSKPRQVLMTREEFQSL